jgi:hypothetical protein
MIAVPSYTVPHHPEEDRPGRRRAVRGQGAHGAGLQLERS